MKRINYVDINNLNLIFSLTILCHHVIALLGSNNYLTEIIGYFVSIAVPYFFVSSAFFLFNKIDINKENKKQIIIKYIKRILILYLAWTAIMFVFRIPDIYACKNAESLTAYLLKYIRVVLFIGEYQLWYLLGLIQALIIIYFFRNYLQWTLLLGTILYAINVLSQLEIDFFANDFCFLNKMYFVVFGTYRNGIFVGLFFMMTGYICYFKMPKTREKYLIIGIITIISLLVGGYVYVKDMFCLSNLFNIVTITGLFICATYRKKQYTNTKSIKKQLSSLVYLSHMAIIIFVNNIIEAKSFYTLFIISVCLTLVLSYIIIKSSNRIKILKYLY